MYKCKYTFWDEKNFPGFQKALSDLYDRSIYNYLYNENHDKKDKVRDLNAINNVFPLIEYYYVSLIKLGYVDKNNFLNILERLKSIEFISVLNSETLKGVTLDKKIYINPRLEEYEGMNGQDMFRLIVFHELGHVINNGWSNDVHKLCDRMFNNIEIKNRLQNYGIKSKNDLVDGFILLEDVLTHEVSEDILYRSKGEERPRFTYYQNDMFPNVKFRSNYTLYRVFQELALKFFRCFKTCDCFNEKTVSEALKKSCLNSFYKDFVVKLEDEMNTDVERLGDFALMLGFLGKIKNANYEVFGLGTKSNPLENTKYYNLFMNFVKDKIISNTNENKHVY